MKSVEKLLLAHCSVRHFSDRAVSDDLIERIITCAQHAATSEYIQSYSIIRVYDFCIRKKIFNKIAHQSFVLEAPVFLVFCADVSRLMKACKMNSVELPDSYLNATETFLMSTVDTAIAAQNAVIAAESFGLGTTYVGGVRNHVEKMIDLLHLPKGTYPVLGLALGYPQSNKTFFDMHKPRLPLKIVYQTNYYESSNDEKLLCEYDETVRKYYQKRTGGVRCDTWTSQMSAFVQEEQRPHLKQALERQGFGLK